MNWEQLIDEIIPSRGLKKANLKLYEIIDEISQNEETAPLRYMVTDIDLEKIEKYYEYSIDAKKAIEEKLKISLISLTFASSFALAIVSVVLSDGFIKQSGIVLFFFGLFLVSAVSYFIYSGVLAMEAMSEKNKVYRLSPSDEKELNIIRNGCLGPRSMIAISKNLEIEKRKRSLAVRAELNTNTNLIRQNCMFISFKCIRNGIISMALTPLVLFFGVVSLNWSFKEQNKVATELGLMNKIILQGFASVRSSNNSINYTIKRGIEIYEDDLLYRKLNPSSCEGYSLRFSDLCNSVIVK